MQFIRHRINRIRELEELDLQYGAEIDLRSDVGTSGQLHLSHDPWVRGDDFEAWLALYAERGIAGPLILNTKEDGLEERIFAMLAKAKIDNFFFLDTALPTLVKWMAVGKGASFAVRCSAFEPPDAALKLAGEARPWAWVDCFGGEPLPVEAVRRLLPRFRICLVSPELQGQPLSRIDEFLTLGSLAEAICTKQPGEWTRRRC